jgi:hypothetical protein
MRRRRDATVAAKQAQEGMIGAEASGAVQEQQWGAIAAFPHVERNIRQLDCAHDDFLP